MLEIKNITKIYEVGDLRQRALNKVNINFRKSEFAAILGPSGSGKTTLLNIIGGLDKYTSGDLIINGVSTKEYKDNDWDSYRNHRIGFVFQSYNLISHQTVLQNVVLALTISGISKKECVRRAKKALCDVGLEKHIYKKPNQLSGGQMQRVAIARALVNDPDILLADEPTGALDSETSVQIMNLLKEISKDKLIIMVTHNPDLAHEYANRIINLKDGEIIDDSNPYKVKSNENPDEYKKTKKTVMSFFTALSLSFNNLMTKKGRTILVSVAGSIGIIGIALIMSLSNGFQNYIDKLQEDTLSSYPLTITNETADMTGMLLSMVSGENDNDGTEKVSEKQYISSMFSNISTNDLKSFKGYMNSHNKEIKNDVSYIKYSYSVDPLIYSKNSDGELNKLNPNQMFSSMYGGNGITSLYSSYSSIFNQMIDDMDTLSSQYQILKGRWPEKYNELVLILSEANSIPDLLVYFLGLRDMDELYSMISNIMEGKNVESQSEAMEFTYDDLMNIELKLINPSKTYKYNSKYDIYEDMSDDEDYMSKVYNSAETLKIVGIVTPNDSSSMGMSQGVGYTSSLISHIIDESYKSDMVKKQLKNTDTDVFSNTKFDEVNKKKNIDFQDMISVDTKALESAFGMKISENDIKNMTSGYMGEISSSITTDTSVSSEAFGNTLKSLATGLFNNYILYPKNTINSPHDESIKLSVMYLNDVEEIVNDYLSSDEAKNMISKLESDYVIPSSVYETAFKPLLIGLLQGYISSYYELDPSLTTEEGNYCAIVSSEGISTTVNMFMEQALIVGTINTMGSKMTEAKMQKDILTSVGNLTSNLMGSIASSFNVDPEKIASAFKFNMSEEELSRLMSTMMSGDESKTSTSNLITLGYQDLEDPTSISVYFNSFDSKENFLEFIDKYNSEKEKQNEEDKVINYTDITGILMSSVKKIVNSVSYVLIAFVSISLVVSSIMIGIITYISVLERTKEIGILRAIGASKRNVSSIFNAETFIIGFLSGLIGVGFTYFAIPIINTLIHNLTDNMNLNAALPITSAIMLVLLSILLTLIGGFIPSKKASKQDPVIALRTE